jgi:hypothetical protein
MWSALLNGRAKIIHFFAIPKKLIFDHPKCSGAVRSDQKS